MPKTDRTNAERQARWRARQAEKLAELERKASNQDETTRLKAELERLRVALREGTSELARLDDENQRLRVELARLKQDAKPDQDKPTRKPRKKKPA